MGQAGRRGRWAVLVAVGALMVAGCSSSASIKGSAPSPGSGSSSGAKAPAKSWGEEPAMTIDTTKKYTMTLHTNQGDIVIAMDASKTPHTVNSMNFLASQHFYDGSYCHRLSTSGGLQMLQCGDPTAGAEAASTDGAGGPGYQFQDENLAGATYPDGTVAMANRGPGTNGSQFFLVFADTQLTPDYTPFGKITTGHDILTKVAAGGIASPGQDGTGRPNIPVRITSVTVNPS